MHKSILAITIAAAILLAGSLAWKAEAAPGGGRGDAAGDRRGGGAALRRARLSRNLDRPHRGRHEAGVAVQTIYNSVAPSATFSRAVRLGIRL